MSRARLATSLRLRALLNLTAAGEIIPSAANLRKIQALPKIFQQALATHGYDDALAVFVDGFDGGLTLFEDVLKKITDDYVIKPVSWSGKDRALLSQMKQGVVMSIDDVIDRTARSARNQAVYMVGGSPFEAVAIELAERLGTSVGQASGLAATGISTFYRTAAAKGYEKIENELAEHDRQLEYTYHGPPASDKFIRPFCQRLMKQAAQGRTWSKSQIDRMDNGQLEDVFTTCGGWRCRHQWIVALDGKNGGR